MLTVFGISNCGQVKKSLKWLNDYKIEFDFHDYKKQGITKKKITDWCNSIDWEQLLNKRSRTWKDLSAKDRSNLTKTKAIEIMHKHPMLIKRPVTQNETFIHLGFDSKTYTKQFK